MRQEMCSTADVDSEAVQEKESATFHTRRLNGPGNKICKSESQPQEAHHFIFHNYHEKPDFSTSKHRSATNAHASNNKTPPRSAPSPTSSPPIVPCWVTSNSPTTNSRNSTPPTSPIKFHNPKNPPNFAFSPTNPANASPNPTNSHDLQLTATPPRASTPPILALNHSPPSANGHGLPPEPTTPKPTPSPSTKIHHIPHNSPTTNSRELLRAPAPTATSPNSRLRIIITPHRPKNHTAPPPTHSPIHDPLPTSVSSPHDPSPPTPTHISSRVHDSSPIHISSPTRDSSFPHDSSPTHISSPTQDFSPHYPSSTHSSHDSLPLSIHSLYPSPIPDDVDHPPLTNELCTSIVEFLFKFVEKTRDEGILRDTAYKTYDAFSKGLLDAPGVHLVKITPKMGGQYAQFIQYKGDFELQNYARYCQGVAGSSRIGIEFESGMIAAAVSEWVAIANEREETKRERRKLKQELKREQKGIKKRTKVRRVCAREEDIFYRFVDVKPEQHFYPPVPETPTFIPIKSEPEPQPDPPVPQTPLLKPIKTEPGMAPQGAIDVNQLFQDTNQLLCHIASAQQNMPD
eukprot:Phypoly_transcript_02946.p1 GENE.Phypoly_transcript_02946~~Phypoly_transcript_02946.p1  ORF type:complete len:572 (+),score=124.44 Phypoly_transcript_02946:844-2559(+)